MAPSLGWSVPHAVQTRAQGQDPCRAPCAPEWRCGLGRGQGPPGRVQICHRLLCDQGRGPPRPCPWDVGVSGEPPLVLVQKMLVAVSQGQNGPLEECVLFVWFAD